MASSLVLLDKVSIDFDLTLAVRAYSRVVLSSGINWNEDVLKSLAVFDEIKLVGIHCQFILCFVIFWKIKSLHWTPWLAP